MAKPKFGVPDADGVLQTPYIDSMGREVLSPIPIAPPVGYKPRPSIVEQIRQMVRREMSAHAQANGHETFEEADDFDVDDEFDPSSPYEEVFEPPVPPEPPKTQVSGEGREGGEQGSHPQGSPAQPPAPQTSTDGT